MDSELLEAMRSADMQERVVNENYLHVHNLIEDVLKVIVEFGDGEVEFFRSHSLGKADNLQGTTTVFVASLDYADYPHCRKIEPLFEYQIPEAGYPVQIRMEPDGDYHLFPDGNTLSIALRLMAFAAVPVIKRLWPKSKFCTVITPTHAVEPDGAPNLVLVHQWKDL